MSAPRVSVADLEAEIASEHYFTAADGVLGALSDTDADPVTAVAKLPQTLHLFTFCVLVLRNGIKVTGESVCVSAANFNAGVGRELARTNAVSKLWPLLGFRLADRLAAQGQG